MEKGDIIAYRINQNTTNWLSKAIHYLSRFVVGNWLTKDQESYNHVSILSEVSGEEYEATWPCVERSELNWGKYDVFAVIYRKGLTIEQRNKIIEYCQKQVGKKYDWLFLISFGLFKLKNRKICSQLVGDAYKHAGIELRKPDEKLLSPNEIVHNKNFKITQIYKKA